MSQCTVDRQDNNPSKDGEAETAQVEAADRAPAQLGADPTADRRAKDAEHDREKETATIPPRHNDLRQDSGEQTKDQPTDNTHTANKAISEKEL